MPKLYACIISVSAKKDKEELISIAQQFSYGIEMLEDGVLFAVDGLETLIGKPEVIAKKILGLLKKKAISGNVAVAVAADSALLLARQNKGLNHTVTEQSDFQKLPLQCLKIENDSIRIFDELGINSIEELQQIPVNDLINRYGQGFREVIEIIEQNGSRVLTPNIKDSYAAWSYELDIPVDDFGQLIFILNHGLDNLLGQIDHQGFSTEYLDIFFRLNDKSDRDYSIKTSFPTLEKAFWLKLINLRISLDPPRSEIMSVKVTAHFTRPRPDQKGLYAVSRPNPESLLLTVNKIKKLVGEDNVGIPVLLNQRLAESFKLDADTLPAGKESIKVKAEKSIIALVYFNPPLAAEVVVRDKRLIFLRTQLFEGHVLEYSGVWKANSKWWDKSWKTEEWDVEIEKNGIYRLCKVDKDWFLAGEYD